MTARITAALAEAPIDVAAGCAAVADPACGGIGLFVGVVRDHHEGATVTALEYEAWTEQATAALHAVGVDVAARHPEVRALYLVHRVGTLAVGDVSVVVAAAAPHRADALEATHELIDRLKEEVPIWKKEHLADGTTRWIGSGASTTIEGGLSDPDDTGTVDSPRGGATRR